jgi:hypothetical protein
LLEKPDTVPTFGQHIPASRRTDGDPENTHVAASAAVHNTATKLYTRIRENYFWLESSLLGRPPKVERSQRVASARRRGTRSDTSMNPRRRVGAVFLSAPVREDASTFLGSERLPGEAGQAIHLLRSAAAAVMKGVRLCRVRRSEYRSVDSDPVLSWNEPRPWEVRVG